MDDNLSEKQKKKIEALNRRKVRVRVSSFRKSKKEDGFKQIQFYIDEPEKEILDQYKAIKKQTTGEVFKELINTILKRRLKDLV